MSYKELLKRQEWKEKREIVLERDGYKCKCGKTKNLQVHHKKYIKGRMPWHYANKHLITLCATCHKSEHVLDDDKFANNIKAVTSDPSLLHNELRHRMHGTIDNRPKVSTKFSPTLEDMKRITTGRFDQNPMKNPIIRNLGALGGFKKKLNKGKPKKYRRHKFETLTWGVD
jgi:hypothetical protein